MKQKKWTEQTVREDALKYSKISHWRSNSPSAYQIAYRLGILSSLTHFDRTVVSHNLFWTKDRILIEARKFKTRMEWNKQSNSSYCAAHKLKIIDLASLHMPKHVRKVRFDHYNFKWTKEATIIEAKKFKTRLEWQRKSSGSYDAALRMSIIEECALHMPLIKKWTFDDINKEAVKYSSKKEWSNNSPLSYNAACKRKIINEFSSHMKPCAGSSIPERELLNYIKQQFHSCKKIRKTKINIPNKPHIKGFDIDVFIPELNKGIEFDGKYWHSVNGLQRSRKNWPLKDINNYHTIKDEYFKSIGIEILHIEEKEWISNKNECLKKIFKFLRNDHKGE